MKKRFIVLYLLILSLSLVIRLFHLTQTPEGFDQTEAAFGYNAYSVLKSGRDEYGKFLPLVLVSVGDYKLAGYMYWQIPFIAAFGLSEFSTRLSAAAAGMISLALVYFIVHRLLKKRKIALLTFFFMGFAPWHIILSRMGYDPVVALMFTLFSIAFFIHWYKTEGLSFLLFSALALCLGIVTYYAVWVIAPFTLIIYWILIFKTRKRWTTMLYASLILLLPVFMMVKLLILTQGERLLQDSTYQVHAYPLLEEQIREDQLQFPRLMTRAFHNKLFFYPQILLQNLSSNLSLDFLFLRGDKSDRRFYVPYHGVLYLWAFPFVILGMLYFWKHHTLSKNVLILGAIFVIFIGSSFSEFGSETERTILAIPLFCFLISYGLLTVCNIIRKTTHFSSIFPGFVALLLSINIAYFNHQYYWHAKVHEPWGRNFGMKEMLSTLPPLIRKYKRIIIPDSAYIFYYFYNQVNPEIAIAESAYRLDKANFIGISLRAKVGDYYTMPLECPSAGKLNVLYVCRGTKIPKNSHVISVIYYPDEQPAFILLEFMSRESLLPPPKNIRFMDKYAVINEAKDIYWQSEEEIL